MSPSHAEPRGPVTLVCDLDGVVYLRDRPVEGAAAALRRLEDRGHQILFSTNNATRSSGDTAEHIRQVAGYEARSDQVLTSAMAAAALVAGSNRPCLVLGGAGINEALEDVGVAVTDQWRDAGTVVVGLTMELSYERLRDACSALRAGARFVATNLDATFPTPEGPWPGAGSLVAAVEKASDRVAEVAGKPYAPMQELILSRARYRRVWMVGDRPETDLAMARAAGWTAVLVLTGVTASPEGVDPPADLVIPSLPGLVAHLA